MIAYVDSSVVLRIALRQSDALREWKEIDHGITSALAEVECLRTVDRLRVAEKLDDGTVATLRETVYRVLDTLEIVELTEPVLSRAAQPMPTVLGTRDALHLATALLARQRPATASLVLATHDEALGLAARAHGLPVVGIRGRKA